MHNILLVDDHQLTRMGIRMALSCLKDEFSVVAEASGVKEAQKLISTLTNIDIILLDIDLIDGNGLEVALFVKDTRPEIKVLVLSMESNPEIIQKMMLAGARGFVSKESDSELLVEGLRAIALGQEFLGGDIAKIINKVKISKSIDNNLFTGRELEIVKLCAKGYCVKQIADELFISVRTVETHKNIIFKKMGFNSTSELVRYAFEYGIVKM